MEKEATYKERGKRKEKKKSCWVWFFLCNKKKHFGLCPQKEVILTDPAEFRILDRGVYACGGSQPPADPIVETIKVQLWKPVSKKKGISMKTSEKGRKERRGRGRRERILHYFPIMEEERKQEKRGEGRRKKEKGRKEGKRKRGREPTRKEGRKERKRKMGGREEGRKEKRKREKGRKKRKRKRKETRKEGRKEGGRMEGEKKQGGRVEGRFSMALSQSVFPRGKYLEGKQGNDHLQSQEGQRPNSGKRRKDMQPLATTTTLEMIRKGRWEIKTFENGELIGEEKHLDLMDRVQQDGVSQHQLLGNKMEEDEGGLFANT